jgi:hypothetical protein
MLRFCYKLHNLMFGRGQQGIIPLMTQEEISQYALRAVVHATTHEDFEKNLGKVRDVRLYSRFAIRVC